MHRHHAHIDAQFEQAQNCCRDALKAVAAAQRRAEMLAQDNAALVLQLNARPTAKQHSHLQRQVELMYSMFGNSVNVTCYKECLLPQFSNSKCDAHLTLAEGLAQFSESKVILSLVL